MGRVSGEEDVAVAHALGNRGVESVGGGTDDAPLIRCHPGGDQRPDEVVGLEFFATLAGQRLELPAAVPFVTGDESAGTGRVADLLHRPTEFGVVPEPLDVDDDPLLVEALIDCFDAERLADATRCAVACHRPASGDEIPAGQVDPDPVSRVDHRGDLGGQQQFCTAIDGGFPKQGIQVGLVVHRHRGMAEAADEIFRQVEPDDAVPVDVDELGAHQRRDERPDPVVHSEVLERPLGLVVHTDGAGKSVDVRFLLDHHDFETLGP